MSHFSGKIDSLEALTEAMHNAMKYTHFNQYGKSTTCLRLNDYTLLFQLFGPIDESNFWKYREWMRLNVEPTTYCTVEGFTQKEELRDHFLHVALGGNSGAMVAFTENEEKGRRDLQLRMKFGKYLTRFYPEMDNERVKELVAKFNYDHGAAPALHIGDKAEDFLKAIKGGTSDSCMSDRFYSRGKMNYAGHEHPAICYAAGDIEVLWLEDEAGRVTARTLANKETKHHARVYGDRDKMMPLLEEAGYAEAISALSGCRLLVIRTARDDGFLMPYVDAGVGSGGGSLHAELCGDYWTLNSDDQGVDTYRGYENRGVTYSTEDEDECICAHCGDGMSEDDSTYVDDVGSVCDYCLGEHFVNAIVNYNGSEEYIYRESATCVEATDEWYKDSLDLGRFDLVYAEDQGEWINLDDAVQDVEGEWQASDDCTMFGENNNGGIYILDNAVWKYKEALFKVNDEWVHEDSDEYKEAAEEVPGGQCLPPLSVIADQLFPSYVKFVYENLKAGEYLQMFDGDMLVLKTLARRLAATGAYFTTDYTIRGLIGARMLGVDDVVMILTDIETEFPELKEKVAA